MHSCQFKVFNYLIVFFFFWYVPLHCNNKALFFSALDTHIVALNPQVSYSSNGGLIHWLRMLLFPLVYANLPIFWAFFFTQASLPAYVLSWVLAPLAGVKNQLKKKICKFYVSYFFFPSMQQLQMRHLSLNPQSSEITGLSL